MGCGGVKMTSVLPVCFVAFCCSLLVEYWEAEQQFTGRALWSAGQFHTVICIFSQHSVFHLFIEHGAENMAPEGFLVEKRQVVDWYALTFSVVPSCSVNEYVCASGGCVSASLRCDGHDNCLDGSDEVSATWPKKKQPKNVVSFK